MSEIVPEHTALANEEHQQLGLLVSEFRQVVVTGRRAAG